MYFFDQLEPGENREGYQKLLADFGNLIRDSIRFTWNAWGSTQSASYAEQKHYPLTVMVLTRHICEQLGGVEALVIQGCAEPCKPLLRSSFEAVLGIQYVLESDSENRGMAYQVAHAHRQISFYRKLDPTEESGKQLVAALKNDPLASGFKWTANTKPMVANLQEMLARPEFLPIEAEWQRMTGTGKKKRKTNWFALFGGPSDVEQLAKRFNHAGMYEFLYRHWSNAVHAGDCLRCIARGNGFNRGEIAIKPIQHPEGLQSMVVWSAAVCHLVARALRGRWATQSENEIAEGDWNSRVQPRLNEMYGRELIVAKWN